MTRTKHLTIILFLGFCIINSYSQDIKFNKDSLLKINTYFNDQIDDGKLAGVITLIAVNSKIEQLKPYGYLDIGESTKMNKDVMIPIASMTKIITTIAILQLQETGQLNIDDPIEKYIPEFENIKVLVNPDSSTSEKLKHILTIRDLLRHTAGMVYTGGNTYTDSLYKEEGFQTWKGSLEGFVEKVTTIPLAYQPNQNWIYSYSHDVLGYLVEIVSGKPLNTYCMVNIFQPLGLKNTDFYVPQDKSDRLSNLYIFQNDSLIIEDSKDSSIYNYLPNAISGGGGWWSSYGGVITTIEDYYVIAKLLLNFGSYNDIRILTNESVKSMISNQIGEFDAYGNKYGLGVGVIESQDKKGSTEEIFWAGAPYNTYFWINYKNNLIGILFTNTAPFGHLGMMGQFKELTEKAITD